MAMSEEADMSRATVEFESVLSTIVVVLDRVTLRTRENPYAVYVVVMIFPETSTLLQPVISTIPLRELEKDITWFFCTETSEQEYRIIAPYVLFDILFSIFTTRLELSTTTPASP